MIEKLNQLILIILLFLTLIFTFPQLIAAAPPTDFQTSQIIGSGLVNPTGFEFAPDGRIFILQQKGQVYIYKNGQLLSQPFATLPVSQAGGDLGLLGLTFDPDFTTNHFVYFYYTSDNNINTVARYNATNDTASGSPFIVYESFIEVQQFHAGGTIQFGPDGKLYVSIGDNQYPPDAQSLNNPAGKILRINKDGTIPSDNPFFGQNGRIGEIWAYGLRNPFRFQFDKASGKMYLGDVGQDGREEVNVIVKGGNYGWPTCEGPCNINGLINPLYSYPHNGESMSITGGLVYNGSTFPSSYQGSYIFGDYAAGFMKILDLDGSGNLVSASDFDPEAGSVVDMKEAPDGSIYYLTIFPGRLYKIAYTISNYIPIVVASADTIQGQEPLTVHFSSLGTNDPDGTSLTYNWDFGDGTFSVSPNPTKIYSNRGRYIVNLTVSDGVNQAQAVPIIVQAGTPPVVNILEPLDGSTYRAGDTISYSASATDSDGNVLDESAFITEIIFHHSTHTHPFLLREDNNSGEFEIPTTGETSADTWHEIRVTAMDADGLTAEKSVEIIPLKVQLNFVTSPLNLSVLVDSQVVNTPDLIESVVGFERELNTPPVQFIGGTYYQFDSWSVGGSQKHFFATPETDTTITATFKSVTSATGQFVTSFSLINADTDQVISTFDPLDNGEILNLSTLPTTNLNVRADTYPPIVGSVRFAYDANPNFRTESYAPYALGSDEEGDYNAWTPTVGTHTISATPYTGQNAGGSAGAPLSIILNVTQNGAPTPTLTPTPTITLTPTPTPLPQSGQTIASYTLINADSDQVIGAYDPIPENAVINLATLTTQNLNIRANTNPVVVGSVRFALDATLNFRTESYAPYALGSDEEGDYNAWIPALGAHILVATPFTSQNAGGSSGVPLTLHFTITNQTGGPTPTPTPTPILTPTPTEIPTPTPTPMPTGQFVQSFSLINADTDQPISTYDPIDEGEVIKLSTLPTTNLNIRANTSPSIIGSLRFGYDANSSFQIENIAPYAFAGDEFGDYYSWIPALGAHSVTATPYSSSGTSGTVGTSLTRTFTVEN